MIPSLVSVVIPVFNVSRFLVETINSALNQTYQPLEIIAVNDGSSDDSLDLLRSFGNRIIVIDQPNSGPSVARNRAVENSSGEYLAFLDADDVWQPTKIERQVAVLKKFQEAVAVYCDHSVIDAAGNVVAATAALGGPRASGQILQQMLKYCLIVSPSIVMVRRSAFDQVGGFDESVRRMSEDYNLWLRLASVGPILYDLDTLVSYRRHDTNYHPGPSIEYTIGDLHAFKILKQFMAADRGQELHEQLRQKIHDTTMELAWRYTERNDWHEGFKTYLSAIRQKPFSAFPWLGLTKVLPAVVKSQLQRLRTG